jgi:hypothetical protein
MWYDICSIYTKNTGRDREEEHRQGIELEDKEDQTMEESITEKNDQPMLDEDDELEMNQQIKRANYTKLQKEIPTAAPPQAPEPFDFHISKYKPPTKDKHISGQQKKPTYFSTNC